MLQVKPESDDMYIFPNPLTLSTFVPDIAESYNISLESVNTVDQVTPAFAERIMTLLS